MLKEGVIGDTKEGVRRNYKARRTGKDVDFKNYLTHINNFVNIAHKGNIQF